MLHSVATVYRRLLAMPNFERAYDLSSLRCAHATGEALREATYNEWKNRVGAELYEHYGVSEYQLVIGQGVRHPVKPGSVGKLLPGVSVAILDDDFKPVPNGELASLRFRQKIPAYFSVTTKTANERKRSSATVGTSPATLPIKTRKATSTSPGAATTVSKAAASSSRRRRSKTPCKNIRRLSKPPWLPNRTPRSATRFGPWWF